METTTGNPDINWYVGLSRERGVTPRCPFASVETCPRYYSSLSLLGNAGSGRIPPDEEERLKARWEGLELWSKSGESIPGMFGNGKKYFSFVRFCPEVIYDRFDVFAVDLTDYYDSEERYFEHQKLRERNRPEGSWQWAWQAIRPMHFTECPLYSPLAHARKDSDLESNRQKGEVLTLKPGIWGVSVDLKELGRRCQRWMKKLWPSGQSSDHE